MPSQSELHSEEFRVLPAAPRYLRRNASRAMAGYLLRGLIELVTNSRDSAYRLLATAGSSATILRCAVEIEYCREPEGIRFVIRDRFEGMSAEMMQHRLLQYGNAASEYAGGGLVRGMNARGAKDVAVLGTIRYESIRDGKVAECVIREAMYRPPSERVATEADRARLEIGSGNGTAVTLNPFPDVSIPNFETLARDLEHHVEIRYCPPGAPRVGLVMREVKNGRTRKERDLVGYTPPGEPVLEQEIPLPEYSRYGEAAQLRLFRASEPLQVGGNAVSRLWRSEAGILVADGRTAHDITWFRARGAEGAAARHLWGTLTVPQVPGLLLEYEGWEQKREADPTIAANPLNPVQVTDPDRFGLNEEHPFIRLLGDRVRPVIEQALASLESDLTPSAQERVSTELRQALRSVGQKLAHALEVTEGSTRGSNQIPRGLSVIPAGLRLEVGQTKRLGIYLRGDPVPQPEPIRCNAETRNRSISFGGSAVILEPVVDQPGLHRGFLEVTGVELTPSALISVSAGDHATLVKVSVREPARGTVSLDRDLQFSQRRYTSVPGRRKHVEVFADASLIGRTVSLDIRGFGVGLDSSSAELRMDKGRGIAVASFTAEAAARALGKLEAECGELKDHAQIAFEPLASDPEIQFLFTDRKDFGPGRRFQWDIEAPDRLLIAAKHSTLSRLLGNDLDSQTGEKWPGQHAPQTRAALAEIIAEAYVARRLDRELANGSLGYGPENLVDPVEYENLRYRCFDECFLICHEALTPSFQ